MDGYDRLGSFQGTYPSMAIARRFNILSARDINNQAAQIVACEARLLDAIEENQTSPDENRRQFQFHIGLMEKLSESSEGDISDQWKIELEMRSRLRDYRSDVLQFHAMQRLAPANKTDLDSLRQLHWRYPDKSSFLVGREGNLWNEKYEYDLVCLDDSDDCNDWISQRVENFIISKYHRFVGQDVHEKLSVVDDWKYARDPELYNYSNRTTRRTVSVLSTILASILPSLSAFTLLFVDRQPAKLGLIVLLSVLFSSVLTVVANARRVECFSVTAAYTAVLVVFIGGAGAGGQSSS